MYQDSQLCSKELKIDVTPYLTSDFSSVFSKKPKIDCLKSESVSDSRTMSVFTLPEMKDFKRRMVENMIRDIQKDLDEERKKWDTIFKVYVEFDNEMSLENYEEIQKFSGDKSIHAAGDRIKFYLMAQQYLRIRLQMVMVDDFSVNELADLHSQLWFMSKAMMKMEPHRTNELRAKFRMVTKFVKIDDNQYEVLKKLPIRQMFYLSSSSRSTTTTSFH